MKKILTGIITLILGINIVAAPTYATSPVTTYADTPPNTAILKFCDSEPDGKARIVCIRKTVANVLTAGVGILGVIGISIVGVQYLTAGGNEEKTRKAKRRLFEIIIGLAVYAVIYALLQFLLPSFAGIDNV